ncbi:arginine/serine-rich coiled-coil protein 2 isoform X1 [Panicum miliaceum]|uniref:Arginine/serine-rich coiled-coil protein 2 isoform X1 n=1 Tax=Panicum miliaceum TaxID=4540 RepID=A0A3L6SQ03_PANMI|nr:arginine/serine-rich coiled-coil protein 2 isoform X1 [Panicum miliaceum]
MEEAKAAAYYDELNRKGEGARRFKQGLGFSSSSSDATSFPSKPTAASSFLSGFVRAGAAPAQPPNLAKPPPPHSERPSSTRRRSRSPPPSRPRTRSRSRSPSRSSRRRSRSRSRSRERKRRSRSRERDRRSSRRRSRSRSRSPSRRSGRSSLSEGRRDRHGDRRHDDGRESSKGRGGRDGGKVDYSRLIEGYDRMTPAERVKAKMKLQLSETSAKDSTLGSATVRWERFEFNKDAPLDEDNNDVEVANDDASLVKNIGKSFRLSAVESKHEDKIRDAHDEAIFGVPTTSFANTEAAEDELKANDEEEEAEDIEAQPSSSLISDKTLSAADCLCLIEPKLKQHYKIPGRAIDARMHEPMRYTRGLQYLQDAARSPFGSLSESARSWSCCE